MLGRRESARTRTSTVRTKNLRDTWKDCNRARALLTSEIGKRVRHHTLLALILDQTAAWEFSRCASCARTSARIASRALPSGRKPSNYAFHLVAELKSRRYPDSTGRIGRNRRCAEGTR